MKIGKVEKLINEIVDSGKGVFMGLIDPDKQTPDKATKIAKMLEEGGADIVMLGGSIGVQGIVLDEIAKKIKENVSIPLHLFPGNIGTVTPYADSIYFMSLLNSKNAYWVSGAQSLAAPIIMQSKIEAIPTGYLVFEPGETVGKIGEANLLPKNKSDLAIAYSLAAKYLGMRFVILESGSGAPETVSKEMVTAIKKITDLHVVVAGGVKTAAQAGDLVKAGASCIHIGTKIEDAINPLNRIKKFAKAIHGK